jgi:putative ubiquitin-RnfH superfamily antitoxin RatB of RatAB toxin-antitoxin module
MAGAETIRVELIHALPDRQELLVLTLPAGTSAAEALRRSGLLQQFQEQAAAPSLAVFGRLVQAGTVLQDGDRLELLRPLLADPKQRRRERAGIERRRRGR